MKQWHWPKLYRYTVGTPGFRRPKWNQYHTGRGRQRIGAYVVLGRYAYCVKWANLLPARRR